MPECNCGSHYYGDPKKCPGCGRILNMEGYDIVINPIPERQYPGSATSKSRIPPVIRRYPRASKRADVENDVSIDKEAELEFFREQSEALESQLMLAELDVDNARSEYLEAEQRLGAAEDYLREVSEQYSEIKRDMEVFLSGEE